MLWRLSLLRLAGLLLSLLGLYLASSSDGALRPLAAGLLLTLLGAVLSLIVPRIWLRKWRS